jgi:hypothetical protein
LKRKKQKVFREGITPFDVMCNIFIDYQHVIFGVILSGVLHQEEQTDIQLFNTLKSSKM